MTPRTVLWLSSPRMTVRVKIQGATIVSAAPIVRTFVGQPVSNLVQWLQRQGDVKVCVLRRENVQDSQD